MLLLKVYADADCDNIVILVNIDRDMIYLVPNLHLVLPDCLLWALNMLTSIAVRHNLYACTLH